MTWFFTHWSKEITHWSRIAAAFFVPLRKGGKTRYSFDSFFKVGFFELKGLVHPSLVFFFALVGAEVWLGLAAALDFDSYALIPSCSMPSIILERDGKRGSLEILCILLSCRGGRH